MGWEHLSVNKPHWVYLILGAFTTLFMLCSSVIKERLYIGEATVATLCGIIFGPHAANLINPLSWGNTDQITLEFSRIVLVVQCFAVGVELPKSYMERHWKSVVFLLLPVMTFGWLITSLFIWGLFTPSANWLDSLCIAACVTATDPVLASSVVGKGKFAKRVPKHLRDLLSCESGCNDGMAFPFVYLAVYIIRYKGEPEHVALHWFCFTILYECVFGAFYGVVIGYIARRMIRYAHEKDWIDRESFLVFYFVLALFCAGSGALLGMDDLLVGFACGVGFSNDGWFTEKTEESHVSNVIDLLINLAFFVYFGTIIPWAQYNAGFLNLDVWRLVVLAFLVLFFRRIPIMLALKPVIPDIKTWREAAFAGHFGPIGVGAIFVAILARAELETGETTPLEELPEPGFPHYNVIELIWPITTFLIITSIIVHGSSIAVFTLGKHINTLSLTMSYTKAKDDENNWMDRLPRIQSRSKSSMSMQRSDSEIDEKTAPGTLPLSVPGPILRRQKDDDYSNGVYQRSPSRNGRRRRKHGGSEHGPGGPISQSAIAPASTLSPSNAEQSGNRSDSDTLAMKSESPPSGDEQRHAHDMQSEEPNARDRGDVAEIYEEGGQTVYEDKEGNVLAVEPSHGQGSSREKWERNKASRLMHVEGADHNHGVAPTKDDPNTDTAHKAADEAKSLEQEAKQKIQGPSADPPKRPGNRWREGTSKMSQSTMALFGKREGEPKPEKTPEAKRRLGPAHAYQFGNTIIVEDADGEVIRKYDIPAPEGKQSSHAQQATKQRIGQMGKILGIGAKDGKANAAAEGPGEGSSDQTQDNDPMRFNLEAGGQRMSKEQFIGHIRNMDPKRRVQTVEASNAPEAVKREARKDALESAGLKRRGTAPEVTLAGASRAPDRRASVQPAPGPEPNELKLVDSNDREIPVHDVSGQLQSRGSASETGAERRRRLAAQQQQQQQQRKPAQPSESVLEEDSEDDGTDRIPPAPKASSANAPTTDTGETAAERRRREGALGIRGGVDESDSEEDDQPRQPPRGIRFADETQQAPEAAGKSRAVRWGKDTGR